MWGQLSTTRSNVLKQPNGQLLVAVNHNQLRTMASETVDPIDWSHPPPSWAVPPEHLLHSINQCTQLDSNVQPQHVRQPPCLCGHSRYEWPHSLDNNHLASYGQLRHLCKWAQLMDLLNWCQRKYFCSWGEWRYQHNFSGLTIS